jgi:hypothetical protein
MVSVGDFLEIEKNAGLKSHYVFCGKCNQDYKAITMPLTYEEIIMYFGDTGILRINVVNAHSVGDITYMHLEEMT